MAKKVKPTELGKVISKELKLYGEAVTQRLDQAGENSIKRLVSITKKTAPVNTGNYKKHIAWDISKESKLGNEYRWYVKPPDHRVTHLLVHGHATRNGKRTKANPFLQDALDTVLPEYEKAVEEAVKND